MDIPFAAAVVGIICIMPWAPAEETADGLKFDSTFAIANKKFTFMPFLAAALSKTGRYGPASFARVEFRVADEVWGAGEIRTIDVGVPTWSTLTTAPCSGASIIFPLPI